MKNKVAPPFKQAEFQIMYGKGINRLGEIIDLGVAEGLIVKSGAWYSYEGDKIGQGKMNAIKYLEEHSELAYDLETELRSRILPKFDESKSEAVDQTSLLDDA